MANIDMILQHWDDSTDLPTFPDDDEADAPVLSPAAKSRRLINTILLVAKEQLIQGNVKQAESLFFRLDNFYKNYNTQKYGPLTTVIPIMENLIRSEMVSMKDDPQVSDQQYESYSMWGERLLSALESLPSAS